MKDINIPISLKTYDRIIYIGLQLVSLLAGHLIINFIKTILILFNISTEVQIPWYISIPMNLILGHISYKISSFLYKKMSAVKNRPEEDKVKIEFNKSFYVGIFGIVILTVLNSILYSIIITARNL